MTSGSLVARFSIMAFSDRRNDWHELARKAQSLLVLSALALKATSF